MKLSSAAKPLAICAFLGVAFAPSAAAQQTPYDPTKPMPDDYRGFSNFDAVRNDENHPLKGDEDPGEQWDAANINNWDLDHRTTPGIRTATGNWPWGDKYYGKTYKYNLTVRNRCDRERTVFIAKNDLPFLMDLPPTVTVPPRDSVELELTVETPPEPDPPINPNPFDPTAPGFGWVPPPDLPPQPNPFDPTAPKWHQPNFLPVEGNVVMWHPWKAWQDEDGTWFSCDPRRVTYNATGHIHFNPPPPDAGDSGPREIAKPDPCVVYWNTGERPPDLEEGRDCTEVFRGLAIILLEMIVLPRVEEDPDAWDWLPAVSDIQSMTAEQLLAFRDRAADILNSEAGS